MGAAMLPESASPPSSQEQQQQSWEIPEVPPDSSFADGVASKDVVVNESTNTWARLYLPETADSTKKLPLLVHVHGGGFVTFSAATSSYHYFCNKMAREAGVLIVSLNHRLAPQCPLPAPYDDLASTLEWLQAQASSASPDSCDPWLSNHADFLCVLLMGGSSGGNIVHNTMIRGNCYSALKIQAQILLQPFFGGECRTSSELRLENGPVLSLSKSDQLWSLALPQGANRDHHFCNPAKIPVATLEKAGLPTTLLLVGGQDLLRDRQVEYGSLMKKAGVHVELIEFPDAAHGFVTPNGTVSYVFMPDLLNFIDSCRQKRSDSC